MFKKMGIILAATVSFVSAEAFFSGYGGLSWPYTLSSLPQGENFMGTVGMEFGGMTDQVFGIGGLVEFSFRGSREESSKSTLNDTAGVFQTYKVGKSIRRRAWSTGVGIWINPLKEMRVRPVIYTNFMPTMMALINDFDTSETNDMDILPPSGAYWGYTANAGGTVHFMASDNISVYGGAGYRFGSVRKRVNYEFGQDISEREYLRQSLHGMTFRAGVMFW